MEKSDNTFGKGKDLVIFAKINDKELANKIKDDEYILNLQFGSVSNDLR